jgi:hypothetical protein
MKPKYDVFLLQLNVLLMMYSSMLERMRYLPVEALSVMFL